MAEATYKIMKTEFVNQMNFQSLRLLELELSDYKKLFDILFCVQNLVHAIPPYPTLLLSSHFRTLNWT
ncbi:IS3 family transposase [Paenibacillus graminis]|uniref:IS3 family transposase n=1 Tax=Paenibacillus graminis TaxID=189425 RepID=UPI00398B791C